ncbi:MAG: Uma2 family endonuclease [Acidobacteriota bacterium]
MANICSVLTHAARSAGSVHDRLTWPAQGTWTYKAYCQLPPDGWRYEVIRGRLHIAPPLDAHRMVLARRAVDRLTAVLGAQAAARLFIEPTDWRLPDDLGAPVRPDVLLLARDDKNAVRTHWIEARRPPLVLDVLPAANWRASRTDRASLYARVGVGEYWVIDPDHQSVTVHASSDAHHRGAYDLRGPYYATPGVSAPIVASRQIEGFALPLRELFAPTEPDRQRTAEPSRVAAAALPGVTASASAVDDDALEPIAESIPPAPWQL